MTTPSAIIAPSPPEVSQQEMAPRLAVKLRKSAQRKSASAQIRGAAIEIVLPQRWSKSFQTEIAQQLTKRLQQQFNRDYQLLNSAISPLISFDQTTDLTRWIHQVNAETLNVPLKGVRIGHAKYSRLAQMNLKTHWMTLSRYCLIQVPESALRYLVIHELAHLKVPNHSKAFWTEVQQFVPDMRHQRRLITAVHRIRLYESEVQTPVVEKMPDLLLPSEQKIKEPSLLKQLLLKLF